MEKKKRSGFDAPAIGTVVPDGTKWKRNPDGTMTPIYPKKSEAEKDKAKKPIKKK